jgi:diacylglycerol kinase family enzyme
MTRPANAARAQTSPATILLNRASGSGRATEAADRVEGLLRSAGIDAPVVTGDGHHLSAAAEQAVAAGSSLLVAGGGDGTVSTVAAVAARAGVTLGILPLGTLNHFARDAGIPSDLEAAIEVIAHGRPMSVDVGDVNGRLFLNNSSLGLYPRLVWEREQEQRRGRRKWPALALAAVRVWRQYRRIAVTVEDSGSRRIMRTPFVFIGNNEYTLDGGRIDSRERLDAGVLQLCVAPGVDRMGMLRIVLAALAGHLGAVDAFESQLHTEVTIDGRSTRLAVSLDGEMTTLMSPLRYRIRRRALRVLMPS